MISSLMKLAVAPFFCGVAQSQWLGRPHYLSIVSYVQRNIFRSGGDAQAARSGRGGEETHAGIGRDDSPLADRAAVCRVCGGSGRANCRRQVERAGRRVLDGDSLRHRRAARKDVPDRLQCHQRLHDRRECAGRGRLCDVGVSRARSTRCAIAYDTRHNSRHFAELCAEIMAAAGFKVFFLDGYRSTPELSFAVRHTEMHLRHHGHGQPQSAQRQRGESVLGRRRASAAAARQRDHRARDESGTGAPATVRRGAGRRADCVLSEGSGCGVHWPR